MVHIWLGDVSGGCVQPRVEKKMPWLTKKTATASVTFCMYISPWLLVIKIQVCTSVTKCCSNYINILTVIDTLIFVVISVRVEYQIHSSELVLLVICPEPKHNQASFV